MQRYWSSLRYCPRDYAFCWLPICVDIQPVQPSADTVPLFALMFNMYPSLYLQGLVAPLFLRIPQQRSASVHIYIYIYIYIYMHICIYENDLYLYLNTSIYLLFYLSVYGVGPVPRQCYSTTYTVCALFSQGLVSPLFLLIAQQRSASVFLHVGQPLANRVARCLTTYTAYAFSPYSVILSSLPRFLSCFVGPGDRHFFF